MVGWMYRVEVYPRVRRAVMVEGMSIREASRVFGPHRDTVRKMVAYSAPPGYRQQNRPRRPKLAPFAGVIDRIPEGDQSVPKKQRHTAQRIYERLRDEYEFDGKYTIVKDYVQERRRQTQEMLVPLSHPPDHAQVDFGEGLVIVGGVERKARCFGIDLLHSYDNTKLAVARMLWDGRRQRTRAFAELQSHYLFEDRFGSPGQGSHKGKVEGIVG